MEYVEFRVKGSETEPYRVVFSRMGSSLKARCDCKAGKTGQLCKHRLAILNGDGNAVVSENQAQVAEVASWLAGSNLAETIFEVVALEEQKKLIDEKIKTAKKIVAKALMH
jgi:uncharacterized Zn finger protein